MESVLVLLAFIFGVSFLSDEGTEVLLLENNKTQAITFATNKKTEILSNPNEYLQISEFSGENKKILAKDEVRDKFGTLINSAVTPPKSYLLYFVDGDTLTKESTELLPKIKATIKERMPCELSIIGHTDTVGGEKLNKELSLKRAKKIAEIFKNDEISRVDIYSFGEKNLLIKTPDNTKEPRNRRVEIQIR